MVPRYVIVNNKKRNMFEKKYQLPYGYNGCPIFYNFRKSVSWFKEYIFNYEKKDYIIELHEEKKERKTVYTG